MTTPILYMPSRLERLLKEHFSSIEGYTKSSAKKTAIVFGQLHYWCSRMPSGFYKFKQPCKNNPLYTKGQSWEESLDMSKSTFNPIFDKLVHRHISKTAYRNSTDKFAGKMFCSYMECGKGVNKTYYIMNKEPVKEFIDSLIAKLTGNPSPANSKIKESGVVKNPPVVLPFQPLGVVKNKPLLACARQTAFNTQPSTSLSSDAPESNAELQKVEVRIEEEVSISSHLENSHNSQAAAIHMQMLEIFNKHTGRNEIRSRLLDQAASNCLANFFGGSLKEWDKHCQMIARDDFSMGRTATRKNFQIWFRYAITEASILDIRNKHAYVEDNKPTVVESLSVSKVVTTSPTLLKEEIESSVNEPDIVKTIRREILKSIGDASYKSWFSGDRTTMKIVNGELVLTASGSHIKNHIELTYENQINRILAGYDLKLYIKSPSKEAPRKSFDNSAKQVVTEPCEIDVPNLKTVGNFKALLSSPFSKPKNDYVPKYVNPNDDSVEAKKAAWAKHYAQENSLTLPIKRYA